MRHTTLLIILAFCLSVSAQRAQNMKKAWGRIDSKEAPWAKNASRPNKVKRGLNGRHLSLWASHGRYYDQEKGKWKWQRPYLFGTTEDLFTQTIVVPYLIPMLESAGAYVFTPRERDWQKNEYIIDNDNILGAGSIYATTEHHRSERTVGGYKVHEGVYYDGEAPFSAGTAISVKTASKKNATEYAFTPYFKEPGRYAVYISYPQVEDAVDDVRYTVHHKGIETVFTVNQRIGYGTWVYLGTFDFDAVKEGDRSCDNGVTISNASSHHGRIGIDAVRFGGGMGNVERSGSTSGFARCLEGARYYGQWAGAPYEVYSDKKGKNDYGDDLNVRSLMTNWVGGGSCFMPTADGLGVPIELSLAIHSDAGYEKDGRSIHGSLAIATTDFNDGILSAGVSRQTSLDLASQLLNNLTTDMTNAIGTWGKRYLWDKNYSETRLPEVPSSIIETLSHQSFPDMVVGQHPFGKFTIARSIYKTLLKYICDQHGKKYVVQPLAPTDFKVELITEDKIRLSWTGVLDDTEPTAKPTSYNVYTAIGTRGFDNGENTKSNSVTMKLEPGMQYNFRITACNDGGESFPTEVLSAYVAPNAVGEILVVNGFQRLSAPFIINNSTQQGFDLSRDEGVQHGLYAGWAGKQTCFTKSRMGIESESGLGYTSNEMEGNFVAGNDFNYVVDHTAAIASAQRYSVVSCSSTALEDGLVKLNDYALVDIAFGLQKDDGQLGFHFKTFTPSIRQQITEYANRGGAILVSGSFLGSDMQTSEDQAFMQNVLKCQYTPSSTNTSVGSAEGLGMQFSFYNILNDKHYAATHPEELNPMGDAICAIKYSNGKSAGVGFTGSYSTFTMGFPFECIKDRQQRNKIMQGLLAYLIKK